MGEVWLDAQTWFYKPSVGNLWQERFRGKKFDSFFGHSSHPTQNHALRLYLRVFLNPINKRSTAADADKKNFPVKDWTPEAWEKFKEQFEKQSNLWNSKFWLAPPLHFSLGDFDMGRKFIRPNITCALHTQLVDDPSQAHRTIDVFNIDVEQVHRLDDIDDDNPRLGKFRSDSHHLDAADVRTGRRTVEDDDGNEYTIKNHYTIAHEIGHALGLDHIGVLKHTAKCALAMKFSKEKVDQKTIGFELRKGKNAKVCYGQYEPDAVSLAENIMGLGYKFEEVNASPWTKRMAMHTNTLASDWRVSLARLHPQPVSEKDRHAVNQRKWVAI